ncbi:MAG TPA: hypothetical protein VGV12_08545 [Gemmatimonadales bacterium]|nr:hypothetical protein [Gemmatimonadales bacterium]
MHFLFTDETNLPNDPAAKFFAYGGLIIPPGRLSDLHAGIVEIRQSAGYQPEDVLKFQTNARPPHVSLEGCTTAKNGVVALCTHLECRFIAYVVLHAIAKNRTTAELVSWGASHVIGKFNYFLSTVPADGVVVLDRLPGASEYSLLTDRFTKGLTFSDAPDVKLDRIKLFASSCSNASHASSAMDIVLGTFRYCINQPKNVPAAKSMMTNISKLIWCERDGENLYPFERGLIFRPKEIKVEAYKREYDDLLAWINELLKEAPPEGPHSSGH